MQFVAVQKIVSDKIDKRRNINMGYKELKKILKGLIIVQTTPFKDDSSLDLEGMRANTRWLVDKMFGKDVSLMIEGSNGEFFNQSEEEWKEVVKAIIEEVDGKIPVLVHAAQCSTLETIKRCKYAEDVGADGVIAVLPYYIAPQEEGIYQHYKKICESVNIGVIMYNNPPVSGSWIRPALAAKIAKIPNFVGIKENTSSVISFHLMQKYVEPDAVVICGRGEEIYPFVVPFGCTGFVSFIANIAPERSYAMYKAAMAKDFNRVDEIAKSLTPFFKDVQIVENLPEGASFIAKMTKKYGRVVSVSRGGASMQFAIIKAAMDMIGLKGGVPRLPLIPLEEEDKTELREVLKEIGIL